MQTSIHTGLTFELRVGLSVEGQLISPSGLCVRRVFELMLGAMIAYLSIPVVQNLLSTRQAMNTSFDSFRIVNTYGAFGR